MHIRPPFFLRVDYLRCGFLQSDYRPRAPARFWRRRTTGHSGAARTWRTTKDSCSCGDTTTQVISRYNAPLTCPGWAGKWLRWATPACRSCTAHWLGPSSRRRLACRSRAKSASRTGQPSARPGRSLPASSGEICVVSADAQRQSTCLSRVPAH